MPNVKSLKVEKRLHAELRELVGWSGERIQVVVDRAISVEIEKLKRKRAKSLAICEPT